MMISTADNAPERLRAKFAEGDPPIRLDLFISGHMGHVSRAEAQRLIKAGYVRVNRDAILRSSFTLNDGDCVTVDRPAAQSALPPAAIPRPLDIVHEDAAVIVVDKPAGLPVHPGPGHTADTLVNALLAIRPEIEEVGLPDRPGIVHRLDKDTSGLLLVARTVQAHTALSAAIKERQVDRVYTVLVAGHIAPAAGVIEAPIGRDPRNRQRQAVSEAGKPARTRYRTTRRLSRTTLLEVSLETGRMHQIRVHLASVGHPVVGDPVYGPRHLRLPGLCRQFLHASRLSFSHPDTGRQMRFESALPAELAKALEEAEGQ